MKYRSELDGLRAVAVLAVFFYHCHLTFHGFSVLPGGFLGVDVFFVLSGYLISSIVFDGIDNNNFSVALFYKKRAKRILPALILVIVITLIATYQLLLPDDYLFFSKSALSSLLFISNYYYYSLDSYTAASNLLNFLLHTWSLSAEWQFYLVFPAFILIINKIARKHQLQIVMVMAMASFALACYTSVRNHDLSFYSFATRAWELLAGCLVTIFARDVDAIKRIDSLSKIIPLSGMTMLVYGLLFIKDSDVHPGVITLLPVLGTCLIILFATKNELIGRFLSMRVVVFLGAISYSLYLWHQVVIVVFRIIKHEKINPEQSLLLLAVTIILSIFSYYFIETPFRRKYTRKKVVVALISIVLVTCSLVVITLKKGLPERFGEHDLSSLVLNLNGNKMHVVDGVVCHDNFIENSCGIAKEKTGVPNVILVGDSHAGSLGYSLENFAKNKFNLIQLTSDVCLGMNNIDLYDKGILHQNCHDRSEQFSEYIESHSTVPLVFSARLNWYLSGKQYTNEYGDFEPVINDKQVTKNGQPLHDEILKKLNMWAQTRTIVLIYPEPELALSVPVVLASKIQSKFTVAGKIKAVEEYNFSISRAKFEERSRDAYALLDAVKGKNIVRVYPANLLCDELRCYPYNKDKSTLYYFDDDHLSVHGADMLVKVFGSNLLTSTHKSE